MVVVRYQVKNGSQHSKNAPTIIPSVLAALCALFVGRTPSCGVELLPTADVRFVATDDVMLLATDDVTCLATHN